MTTTNPTFDHILDLEHQVRVARASAECGIDGATRARGERNWTAARTELSAAIDALTTDQMRAYGAYRAAAMRGEG